MTYKLSNLAGDLSGGLTAGIVALPLALAFGVASGAGALAGLYGAITLGLVTALLGGTRVQVSGPTGPMTIVFASALVMLGNNLSLVMMVVLVAGLFQLLLAALRAGVLVRFIPYPVISGFMTGIGGIILVLQLAPLLGQTAPSTPLQALLLLPQHLQDINLQALLLGGITLLLVFLTPASISRWLPSPLVALVVCTLISLHFAMDVPVIGNLPSTLPQFTLPGFALDQWTLIFTLGLTLAVLGSIDSLLTSLVADSITHTHHQPNRELMGQGLGNMLCAFIGGLPGAGATLRTVVNVKAGGNSRLSGVIHALLLLGLLLGLAPLAENIPLAVLAGILLKVGVDILDLRIFKMAKVLPRSEFAILLTVLLLTFFTDLVIAVTAGIILAMGIITWRLAQRAEVSFEVNHDLPSLNRQTEGVRILHIKGPLFFGSTSHMLDRIEAVDAVLDTRQIILDCRKIQLLDASALLMLDEAVAHYQSRQLDVELVVRPHLRNQLLEAHLPHIHADLVFTHLDEAVQGKQS
ncbi:MAG: SulP family inorganic anion transporter [Marinospirillum sp.]|uniref:SulP family inorganic anion transporter n=1 Tax=Marinospirillum sp. TaxID=2183934 RepID=UPI0019E1B607|nr:SulP family inorganic anion transporter [Marinospirillum sp.]MBE0505185.1 SulP family inorganic anion transporter [Marinospirillum sp.]